MKKISVTLLLTFFIVTVNNAQIKNTKISVNSNNVKTDKLIRGLKVNNLNKLKIKDFKKLNIPVALMTKEQLNAKPTRSWKIEPNKIKYASLKLDYFRGTYSNNKWTIGGDYNDDLDEVVESLNNGRVRYGRPIFAIGLKFRATGGAEYRLKFKNLNQRKSPNEYIFISREGAKGTFISRVDLNDRNEFNYIFKEERSNEVTLKFSAIPNLDYTPSEGRVERRRYTYYWQYVSISEIKIDRIN